MVLYVTANRGVTLHVSFSAFYQIPCVLKFGFIALSNTYRGKRAIACKLIPGSSGMTATD